MNNKIKFNRDTKTAANKRLRVRLVSAGRCPQCGRKKRNSESYYCDTCRIVNSIGTLGTRSARLEKMFYLVFDNTTAGKTIRKAQKND